MDSPVIVEVRNVETSRPSTQGQDNSCSLRDREHSRRISRGRSISNGSGVVLIALDGEEIRRNGLRRHQSSDSRSRSRRRLRGHSRGRSRGHSRGQSRGHSRGKSRGHSRGKSRGHSRGNSRGHCRGNSRGHSRGRSRGHSRDGSRGCPKKICINKRKNREVILVALTDDQIKKFRTNKDRVRSRSRDGSRGRSRDRCVSRESRSKSQESNGTQRPCQSKANDKEVIFLPVCGEGCPKHKHKYRKANRSGFRRKSNGICKGRYRDRSRGRSRDKSRGRSHCRSKARHCRSSSSSSSSSTSSFSSSSSSGMSW